MKLGYIGLGKMGSAMVARLIEHGHDVVTFDVDPSRGSARTLLELSHALWVPRTIWCMVPHDRVDALFADLVPSLDSGDTIIDGGNSFYKESQRRAAELKKRGIAFLDVGVSGGPEGAGKGACLMIGGDETVFQKHEKLFSSIAAPGAFAYVGAPGAGHFAKMIHNGIEYGMMQSLAEGFALLKASEFHFDVAKIAWLYNQRSVIESRLVGWLADAYREFGADLNAVSGVIAQSGEGAWTVDTAHALGVEAPIIEGSVAFRTESAKKPSYTGKIISALRNRFGSHDIRSN